jgi:hypothetical protein
MKAQREVNVAADAVPGLRDQIEGLTRRLDRALDREVALLNELYDQRAEVKQLTEDNRQSKWAGWCPRNCPLGTPIDGHIGP